MIRTPLARRAAGAVVALALLALAGCANDSGLDDPAPALVGRDFDGDHWDLDGLEGSVVVVTMWASWCAPCRDEVPLLSEAQSTLGPEGLIVLGVNFRDNPDAARSFLEEVEPTYPSIVDADGSIGVDWGITGVPQSFLVDRDGRLADRVVGPVTEEWLDGVVAAEVRG